MGIICFDLVDYGLDFGLVAPCEDDFLRFASRKVNCGLSADTTLTGAGYQDCE